MTDTTAHDIVPPSRFPCRACRVQYAPRSLSRGVCFTCRVEIEAGVLDDVRLPDRRHVKGRCRRPPARETPWTGAEFAAKFFSAEAVERRMAHTLARERARGGR